MKKVSKVPLNFPPYALCLEPRKQRILVAGGGGDSKTGVPNRIVAIQCKNGILCEEQEYDTAKQAVMGVSTSPDGLIAASVDDTCRLYSLDHDGKLQCVSEHVSELKGRKDDRQVKKAKFAGAHLYSAGTDGVVRVWLSPSLDLLKEIPALTKETADFDISTATRSGAPVLLVASREICRVYRHESWMAQPKLLATLPSSAPFKFRNCRFSPDTKFIYTAEFMPQHGSLVRKWDTSSMSPVASINIKFNRDHHTTMNLSSDGCFLALGSAEGELRVLRTSDLKIIHSSKPHSFFVSDVLFHPTVSTDNAHELFVVTCAGDNTVACTTVDPIHRTSWLGSLFRFLVMVCCMWSLLHVIASLFPTTSSWLLSFLTPYFDLGLQLVAPIWEERLSPTIQLCLEPIVQFAEPHIIALVYMVHPYWELVQLDPRFVWLHETVQNVSLEPLTLKIQQINAILYSYAGEVISQQNFDRVLVALGTVTDWVSLGWSHLSPLLMHALDALSELLLIGLEFAWRVYEIASPTLQVATARVAALFAEMLTAMEPLFVAYGPFLRELATRGGQYLAQAVEWLSAAASQVNY